MKPKLVPYLTFNGNCREAMEFYKSVLGGKLMIQTFKEAGMKTERDYENKVVHASLEKDECSFMASDASPEADVVFGGNVNLSVVGSDEEQLSRWFERLAEKGRVRMPLERQFWGDKFGMVTDKFGVNWMVNIGEVTEG